MILDFIVWDAMYAHWLTLGTSGDAFVNGSYGCCVYCELFLDRTKYEAEDNDCCDLCYFWAATEDTTNYCHALIDDILLAEHMDADTSTTRRKELAVLMTDEMHSNAMLKYAFLSIKQDVIDKYGE